MHWRPAFARNFERCRSSVCSSSSDGRGGPVYVGIETRFLSTSQEKGSRRRRRPAERAHAPGSVKKPIGLKIKTSSTRRTIARPPVYSAASSQGRISRVHVVLESDRRARHATTDPDVDCTHHQYPSSTTSLPASPLALSVQPTGVKSVSHVQHANLSSPISNGNSSPINPLTSAAAATVADGDESNVSCLVCTSAGAKLHCRLSAYCTILFRRKFRHQ